MLLYSQNSTFGVKSIFGTYGYDDEAFYSQLKLYDDKKQHKVIRKSIASEMPDFYDYNEKEIDYNKLISLIKKLSNNESEESKTADESEKNEFARDALAYFAGNVAFGHLGGIIALTVKKQNDLEKR